MGRGRVKERTSLGGTVERAFRDKECSLPSNEGEVVGFFRDYGKLLPAEFLGREKAQAEGFRLNSNRRSREYESSQI